jgi:electron transfer flavoprotein beta subunit
MNIVVCIKQVPDVPTIRIDRQRMTIIREEVDSMINPLDSVALEAAMGLREWNDGLVTAITMGPPQSEAVLREALALGADRAVLLTDPAFAGADTLATCHVLATAIASLGHFPDLVLCGMQTIDSDTGHVGPQISEELNIPLVTRVSEIHVETDALVVKRFGDGFLDTLRVGFPVLLTVTPELCPVRDIPFSTLEAAFSEKSITRWGMKDLQMKPEEVGLLGSATKVWRLRPPPPRREGQIVTGSPNFLVETLIKKLAAINIIDEENGNG